MSFPNIEPVERIDLGRRGLRMRPRTSGDYIQHCNVVYAESDGVGLVMDVFVPAWGPNGRAIVDVVAGAWRSDRTRLNEHLGLGAIDAFCAAGFTVFAVAPGSATLFTARQMVAHVHGAIRHVRDNADAWDVDATSLGLCGVSAGGHLAALAALQPEPGGAKARQSWFQHSTAVDAVGLFFPPSDLLDYGGAPFDFAREGDYGVPRLLFSDGLDGRSDDEIAAEARAISPRHQVDRDHPPFLFAHATEDVVVPYSQSTGFVDTLQSAGVDATLRTHEGTGHPWPTVSETCATMAGWFKERLPG